MESIQIDTGEKRIMVNDDPQRVIVFNPTDVVFAEHYYQVVSEFGAKEEEFKRKYAALGTDETEDENGLPTNAGGKLALLRETCDYFRQKIDQVFGEGTSQAAFGDALTLDMFGQFFTGISPYIQTTRAAKIARYVNTAAKPKRPRHTRKS